MSQPIKFYFDLLNQSSRALYVLLEASKVPFEAVPISMLKGENLTGEFRDKVNRFRKLPAIIDHGFQLSESCAIFRHLSREKLVPEHWYPRRNFERSRIDEFLEWQKRNMGLASNEYFQEKWLVPYLQKTQPNHNTVDVAKKRLEHSLNDFENLFLNSKKFMISNNVSFADLMAICDIDQSKVVGYNPFKNRTKLTRWYNTVQDELGSHYKELCDEFESKVKFNDKGKPEAMSVKQ